MHKLQNEHTPEDVMKFYLIKNNEIKTKLTNVIPKKFKALVSSF